MTAIAEYRNSRELFANLALRELRSKYRRSILGWTWSMLNPLTTMVVYTIVFEFFFRARPAPGNPSGVDQYSVWLLCAMLPWNFFTNCVNGSIASLLGNANLIKKSYFPRDLLPAASTAANLVMHLIEMSILMVVLLAFGNWRALVFLPLTLSFILVMAIFALGFGLLFSVLNVYFRDVEHFTSILFLIWLYMTPIIYPETYITKHHPIAGISLLAIFKVNPMTDFAECFRSTLYDGRLPGLGDTAYVVAFAGVVFALGLYVFNRLEGRLAEEL
jgi:ABC-type polysaccharide/polyol phosphate export permease